MDVPTFRRVLRILLRRCSPRNWAEGLDPFEALVSVILSQNPTDLVAGRVMADLASRGSVGAPAIARMSASELAAILRPAGLARQKAPRIQRIARILEKDFGGTMDAFLAAPTARAREMLLALPGVGPKTADVWLSLVAGRDTMPMDTHTSPASCGGGDSLRRGTTRGSTRP